MKRISFFCFLSIVILAIIFHSSILSYLANWSLQTYVVAKWGKSLEYERLYLSGNQLIVIHPHFKNDSSFAAEKMILDFHFNLKKRHLYIDIELEKLHWHLDTSFSSEWKNWEKVLKQEEKWFKIYPGFHIKTGLLTWTVNSPYHHHHLHFDLDTNSKQGGYLKLYFEPQDRTTDYLVLKALSITQGIEVACDCQKIKCSSLFTLTQFLGLPFADWLVTSGSLEGELKAIFPRDQRPYLEGEIFIDQLGFNHLRNPLKGRIEQARLTLTKTQINEELKDQIPTFIGQLDILQPASLSYSSVLHGWSMNQMVGSIELNNMETAWIDLKAQGDHHTLHSSDWILQGRAHLDAFHSLNVDLTLFGSSPSQTGGQIHLSFQQKNKFNRAEVSLEKMSYIECDFLQTLLATYWPSFRKIKLEQGQFNAVAEVEFMNEGIGELHIKQFEAFHLCCTLKPWNATLGFNQVQGHGKVNLGKKDFWRTLHAGLHLEDGKIQFEGVGSHFPLTDIQAHFLIQNGDVEHSLVTLQLAGLKGKMDVEWRDQKELLTFKLDGMIQDIAELLPRFLQDGLNQKFHQNQLMILANIKRKNQQVELGGTLHIQRANSEKIDLLHFGCELKKINDKAQPQFIPFGWFHGQHLPLDKFLSPFIFPSHDLSMTGEAEFKGTFDDHYLTVKYQAENLKIENEDLCIEVKQLCSAIPGQLIGFHQFDLQNYSHQGTLPIQHASYFEKNSGLIFYDIQGVVRVNRDFIHIFPIEAYCEGIYFAGDLKLDYSDPAPKVFKLKIHCPTLSGKVSQIQHLLAYLGEPTLLHKVPLEGEVSAKNEGLILDFDFNPEDYQLKSHIQGIVTDGSLSFIDANMSLKGIYMDVEYCQEKESLKFSDIQGTLLVGKPSRVKEYSFISPHIHFDQIANPDIEVDIAIKDQAYELLRLVGYTKKENEEGFRTLYLNQALSHLSCLYPQVWKCRLKDWSDFEYFEMHSHFNLVKLLQDFTRFRQTGLGYLSPSVLEHISQFHPTEGEGTFSIGYQANQECIYQLEGSHIKLENSSSEHYGILKGRKHDKKWIIDQLQWDHLFAYAELQQLTDKWKIPFLGLKAGQALLLGLNGEFIPDKSLLQANLNFSEVNFAQLEEWEFLKPFVLKWSPKGYLKAQGEIEWSIGSSNSWDGFHAVLLAETEELYFRDYPVQVLKPFEIEVQANKSLCLKNIQCEIPKRNGQGLIDLKQFTYIPEQDVLSDLQFAFTIPSIHLEKVFQSLHHHFPDLLETSVKDIFVGSKQQGLLQGTLTIENHYPSERSLRLILEDGWYRFRKKDLNLKQIDLQIVGNHLHFSAFSQQECCPFQLVAKIEWPHCEEGQCTFFMTNHFPSYSQPLEIKWKYSSQGMKICSMQGAFSGCSFRLKEDKKTAKRHHNGWSALQGQITIDFNRLSPLLTTEMAETIQKLNLDSLYSLKGNVWINPDVGESFLDTFSFQGNLTSEEAVLKGYRFESLQADVQYVPGRLDMKNIVIQDLAGTLKADSLIATLDDKKDYWTFSVPRLTVKNLRFSFLRQEKVPSTQLNSKFRSLMIKRIDLQDFSGELNKQETWQAQGHLHFLNPSRKNLYHPLLAIPAEIILRLGLDPQVLNPVTGILYFDLKGDRFYFTRFKDVYSEGRGSKFYLAQGKSPSWMDFKGNVSLQIRMKQYNLIFKIAELFTVSIQGSIKKPHYTLQRQTKTTHKE